MIEIKQRRIKYDDKIENDIIEFEAKIQIRSQYALAMEMDIFPEIEAMVQERNCNAIMRELRKELESGYFLNPEMEIIYKKGVKTNAEEQNLQVHGTSDDVR